MSTSPISYKRHPFPSQIIAHMVWLYYRFLLSLRHVEEMLLKRGVAVSYGTIRRWGRSSGPNTLAACAASCQAAMTSGTSMKWPLRSPAKNIGCGAPSTRKAMCSMKIVQRRRNAKAARRLLTRLLKKQASRRSA